jgi:hypothetical protein
MFESYKLKKAKAKLELESVNKQLNEIEAQKEQERWEQLPQWQKNVETKILLEKAGIPRENKERSAKYAAIMSGIWTTFIWGILYSISLMVVSFLSLQTPPNVSSGPVIEIPTTLLWLPVIGLIGMTYIELFYVFKRGRGVYLFK